MSKWLKSTLALLWGMVFLTCNTWAQTATSVYPGLGRTATAREIAAWDIDVRADFKGLPKGSGSVAQGQDVWEAKCASCHGVFGESNEVFNPVIGGVTAKDVVNGRVANLARDDYPSRTTMMKLATLSTLWDYINRAMPWNTPKSLKTDEVYAVVAFMLNLSEVVPDTFVLSDQNIAQVQQRMPNRMGMNTDHALWPGREWGSKTTRADTANTACHGVERKIVGPAMTDVAKKYPGQTDVLAQKIKNGGAGVWGPIPMPAQNLPDADAQAIAAWLARGAPR